MHIKALTRADAQVQVVLSDENTLQGEIDPGRLQLETAFGGSQVQTGDISEIRHLQ